MTLGHKLVLTRKQSLRSSPPSRSPLCTLTLAKSSPHSPLFVFSHLRTLSFSGHHPSLVLRTTCALFRKKQGVGGTSTQSFSLRSRLPRELSRGVAKASPLTPSTATLTQKQGGRGCSLARRSFSEGGPALSAVEGSYRSELPTTDCRLLASHSPTSHQSRFTSHSHPPCPTPSFPLQWKHPFPVITGETQ